MQTYYLSEIVRTIQGEGYWTGMPVTLVRLAGCNLRCPFCDTKQSWDVEQGRNLPLAVLVTEVAKMHQAGDIILLTGGEPTLQPMKPLVNALCSLGPVHLETNGTMPMSLNTFLSWITVSPKPGGALDISTLGRADELKWLVGGEKDVEALLEFLKAYPPTWNELIKVSLQPLSQGKEATKICFDACLKYGWRLSIQLQKYIEVA